MTVTGGTPGAGRPHAERAGCRDHPVSGPACRRCGMQLQRHILYGDLRFYVCKPCGAWAVPYPPSLRPGTA
ncbi:MAG: hypothetical protein JOZ41_15135 [Chloroflexi bacterium]|nr:hypothetical protein [Chloroflexota bacterium]